jgi:hypothetical protein
MILRRLTSHLRAQNWPAVGLDLLVVVVGIYLGLQADAWKEARKERVRERDYLEQLHADFQQTAGRIEAMAGFHAQKADDLSWVIDRITHAELAPEDELRFRNAFVSMYQLPPMGATMGIYEAMVASADLALIRDQELKSRLVSLDAGLDAQASLLDYFRSFNQGDIGLTRHLALVVPNEARTGSALVVDFSAVVDDQLALTIVAGQERTQRLFADVRGDLAQEFRECAELIDSQLGRVEAGEQ